jgi:hypothetical protein
MRPPAPSDFEHDPGCACETCHPDWWPKPTPDEDFYDDDPMDL